MIIVDREPVKGEVKDRAQDIPLGARLPILINQSLQLSSHEGLTIVIVFALFCDPISKLPRLYSQVYLPSDFTS